MSQLALAERARLSRQSVGAIESGRATPAVDVALRIAAVLEREVEELFGSPQESASIGTEPASPKLSGRVAMAHIGGRWVSYPLVEDGLRVSADGVVVASTPHLVDVLPLRAPSEARENVVLTGCAAALGLLADRLNARGGPGRFLWLSRSSKAALDALARGHTHLAGVHGDARAAEPNIADVQRVARKEPLAVITLARWQAGLVMRPADVRRIRGVSDLERPDLRLVVREAGAGAQRLLERELRAAGHSLELARHAHLRVGGHLEVARAVALGAADTGVATRDAALVFGLAFVALAEERYDLALPVDALTDPRLARLFDVLSAAAFRRELAALGYDVARSGQRVAEVRAA
jgi:molybdate-binding protein/DNA-binding XRE family transcriptional regulator